MKYLLVVLVLLFSSCVLAKSTGVFLSKTLCDQKTKDCVRGSMDYDHQKNVLEFNGRLKQTTKARSITIIMEANGESRQYRVKLFGKIKGRYSEIVELSSRQIIKSIKDDELVWDVSEVKIR